MRANPLVWMVPMVLWEFAMAAPPLIISQSGSIAVTAGDAFAACVVAEGEGLSYQWFRDGGPVEGETSDTLLLSRVSPVDAGGYQVVVTNAEGAASSEPVVLDVMVAPALGVSPGSSGIVPVPGHPAYYDLYLPTNYPGRGGAYPVLFTFNPGGGGMVGHFRTVAEEKKWIVVGVAQSRNNQGWGSSMLYHRAVFRHAISHLEIDPNRIFMSGMSGGGWASFRASKRDAPCVAGVFSMGGWLGNQHSPDRDIYLPGLLVARANGNSDEGANYYMGVDYSYLKKWISEGNIRDWSFPGGHVSSPEWVQREVFDWFLSLTAASTPTERVRAREQEALWKARITAGEAGAVYRELVYTAFNLPRTPEALAAWRTLDFLLARDALFLRDPLPDFSEFPRRSYLAVHLHHHLYGFMQERDPSRQISAAAAARALGAAWEVVQEDPAAEVETILRHPVHTSFDDYVLENALYERGEPPLAGDWDGDGRDNFGEFVSGTSPLVADGPAQPEMHLRSGAAEVTQSGCRTGPLVRMVPLVTTDLKNDPWEEAPAGDGWSLLRPDGTVTVGSRLAGPAREPALFARFGPTLRGDRWHDANADGIPYEYLAPEYQLPGGAFDGDLRGASDARGDIEMPGGPPLYRRYLTAAEINPVDYVAPSFRYHPALAGYKGYLVHELWMDVTSSTVAGAEAEVRRRVPNEIRLITSSEAPWFSDEGTSPVGDHYFERTRGYIVPAVSGAYRFSIAGDDDSELWLSTGESAAAATRIAHVSGWTGFRNFTQNASQTSAPISLTAGRSYYVKILHREGNGGDHCSVSWITPGSSNRVPIPAGNLRCLEAGQINFHEQ